ncbi:MAG: glycosyltransferase family 9 protein [Candidatus Electrothrix sp. YB6]
MEHSIDCSGKRILIIKPSSLGDIVHTLPLVHALKRCFPDCSIGWIVQQAFVPLLEENDSIDAVYPIHIPSTSEPQASRLSWLQALQATVGVLNNLRQQFRRQPYDLILDLHASFRSGLLGQTNPGGIRIGFRDARELNTFFQNILITVPVAVQHAQEKNLLFCNLLGCPVREEDFYLSTGREARREADAFLGEQGIREYRKIVYANAAARWQSKFWPVEHWASLADSLYKIGIIMVFCGSPQDSRYVESIGKLMRTPLISATGRLSLLGAAALLQRSALYIGLDSGPMHMAALARIPVVALFGPTHPARVGPHGTVHRIVRAEHLDCLECRKRSCSHRSCMREISVQMVYDAAETLLQQRPVREST